MRRSLPKTCSEATVEMAASVSIVLTAFPRTSSSSQLVPCTAPAHRTRLATTGYLCCNVPDVLQEAPARLSL